MLPFVAALAAQRAGPLESLGQTFSELGTPSALQMGTRHRSCAPPDPCVHQELDEAAAIFGGRARRRGLSPSWSPGTVRLGWPCASRMDTWEPPPRHATAANAAAHGPAVGCVPDCWWHGFGRNPLGRRAVLRSPPLVLAADGNHTV